MQVVSSSVATLVLLCSVMVMMQTFRLECNGVGVSGYVSILVFTSQKRAPSETS